MKGDIHVCVRCGWKMLEEEDWSEEEAMAEAEKTFGKLDPGEGRETLCEDCYNAFKKWFWSTRN